MSVFEDSKLCPQCGSSAAPTHHCVELGPDKIDAEWCEVICEFHCDACEYAFWTTVLEWDDVTDDPEPHE